MQSCTLFKLHWIRKGRTSIEDDERYRRLSSLRSTFVTKIKDMLETGRWLTVRDISEDLFYNFTFTAAKIVMINDKNLHISKRGTKQAVMIVTVIFFLTSF